MTLRKKILAVAAAGGMTLAVAACSDGNSDAPTVTETVNTTENVQSSAASLTDQVKDDADIEAQDDVYGAIAAVLNVHPNGVIIDIDREDDDMSIYDIYVVDGSDVLELRVSSDGNISEKERDDDDDDIAKAQSATVTAEDAIREALSQHEGGVLDEAELDEDDGVLTWKIQLDDEQGNDLVEVRIPA